MNFLLCFLPLCAGLHSSGSVLLHTPVVSQSADVSVVEGETVEISCCWTKTAERVSLKWLKNQTLIKHKTFLNQSEGSRNEQKNKCVALKIEKIKTNDSGRYICKVSVEIPVLTEAEGNGTTITVTARENPPDNTDHQTSKEKERIEGVVEDKRDDNSNTHIVDETPSVHLEDKDARHKGKTADIINPNANDKKETISKWEEKSGDNPNPHTANNGSQEEVFTFVLRCLPILALITAFFWLYYLGTKAQKDIAAAAGNKTSSQQNTEEDQEEEKGEVILAEEPRKEKKEISQALNVEGSSCSSNGESELNSLPLMLL